MNLKRTTIIFVSGVALAAWLSAAMTPGRPPAASVVIRPAPIDTKGAVLAGEITRLRERLRPDAAPRQATRNPFVFRSTGHAAPAARVGAVEKDASAAVVLEAPRLRLTLAGIAEDPGPVGDVGGGTLVRTAIIAGNGQVFLAKEGDTVTDRGVEYKVGKISADSVELIDPRDSTIRRLTLR
jgi:hypothetical protein